MLLLGFFQNVKKEDLSKKAKELKNHGDELLDEAKNAKKDLQGIQHYSLIFPLKNNPKAQSLILVFPSQMPSMTLMPRRSV